MARLTACCERRDASRNSDSRAVLIPPISPFASTRFLNLRSCMQQDCMLSYLTKCCSWHIIGGGGLTDMAEECSRTCLHPSSHMRKKEISGDTCRPSAHSPQAGRSCRRGGTCRRWRMGRCLRRSQRTCRELASIEDILQR